MGPLQIGSAVAPEPPPPVIVTVGRLVYPLPALVTVIPVTAPLVICAVADACEDAGAPPPVSETIG